MLIRYNVSQLAYQVLQALTCYALLLFPHSLCSCSSGQIQCPHSMLGDCGQ